jgi:uncharacterized membrane protein YqhA
MSTIFLSLFFNQGAIRCFSQAKNKLCHIIIAISAIVLERLMINKTLDEFN